MTSLRGLILPSILGQVNLIILRNSVFFPDCENWILFVMKGKKKIDIERNKIGGWDNETKDTEKLLRILEVMAKKVEMPTAPLPQWT